MKPRVIWTLVALVLLMAGCARNVPLMDLQPTRGNYSSQDIENKGVLTSISVKDNRPAFQTTPTVYKQTVILSGQTAPPTDSFVKAALQDEISSSGLFTVSGPDSNPDKLVLTDGGIVNGVISEVVTDDDTLRSLVISNSDGVFTYGGSQVQEYTDNPSDQYKMEVTILSAKVEKVYSPLNYVFLVPSGGLMILGSLGSPVLMLGGVAVGLISEVVVPDTYMSEVKMDVILKKGDVIVFDERIDTSSSNRGSQLGSPQTKVQRGSTYLSRDVTNAIQQTIQKINERL